MQSSSSKEQLAVALQVQYEKEKHTLTQLLKLEDMFRDSHCLYLRELKSQKEIIERMWVLTQRYIILNSSSGCCRYPDVFAAPTEDILLSEYSEKLRGIRTSNCRMTDSVRKLQQECLKFECLCSKLDPSMETAFMIGDTFHKPIAFFIELVSDLFIYMHSMNLKLKYMSRQFDPTDLITLEEYKLLLEPSEDFEEYLTIGLTYCKCLRPKPVCPVCP